MRESFQFFMLGMFALGILLLDLKLGTFGMSSDRDRHPMNFWMGFSLTLFFAVIAFAVAIGKAINGN